MKSISKMKKKKFFWGFDDFFGYRNRKNKFPFLVDMSVAAWRNISRSIVSFTEMTLGSTLNSLIRFEISHPYSKETQRRKEEFPFAVDMQEMWKKLMKSMNNMKVLQKLPKSQLSTGDSKV
ncbi:MAG: hypothetical protein LBS69_00110 [Prevotellaceae bacterium]|jgi:hypothetical protein|nr:hypothetical protein [Prevotellaceae bacterium]